MFKDYEELVDYIDSGLNNPQHPLLDLRYEEELDFIEGYYDIDNDLHDTYDHQPLINELRNLNIFDEITETGDGILQVLLGIGIENDKSEVDELIEKMNRVPSIIRKYYNFNESFKGINIKKLNEELDRLLELL